ncbi:MAG: hypothetical protein R3Y38_07405 [Rikenellaceae bacterium]
MRYLILAMFTFLSIQVSFAQNTNFNELLFEAKAQEMKKSLDISDEKFSDFRTIYKNYDTEILNVYKNYKPKMSTSKAIEDGVDTQTALEIIDVQFANADRILEIKNKYLREFSKVLSGTQLIKFYQTENSIRNKTKREFNQRKKAKTE